MLKYIITYAIICVEFMDKNNNKIYNKHKWLNIIFNNNFFFQKSYIFKLIYRS